MWLSLSREQLEAAAEVIMRAPGLFIINYWWQYDRSNSLPKSWDGNEVLNAIIANLVLFNGFLLLLLPLSNVRILYTHFVNGALVIISHHISSQYVAEENESNPRDEGFYKKQFAMLIYHGLSAAIVSYLIQGPWKPFQPMLGCYVLPVVARLADFPVPALQMIHNFSSAVMAINVFLYITYQVPNMLDCIKFAYMDIFIIADSYGLTALLTVLWNKLFVPNQFAMFWLIEFCVKFVHLIYGHSDSAATLGDEWYLLILTTLSSICASPISMVATSVSISYLSFFILGITRSFLLWQFSFFVDSLTHSGWTEGLTFFLLSIQTDLADLDLPGRMAVVTIILFIVLSSLLQSLLEIAEPVILAISASKNRSIFRHLRALSICLALLFYPLYLTHILSQIFPIDFWMMIILTSCILISVQVVDLLIVHALFIYDSIRSEPWENLDDVVYYTRAITKILEFLVAVTVVGMGLWENASATWGWINVSILLVHCYFNVWQRLQTGWRSFLLRREAAKNSESLPAADETQLNQLDDVCSICFSQMRTACITPCRHYFHRTCLRKWLYVQDNCPLCHKKVSVSENTPSGNHREENVQQ